METFDDELKKKTSTDVTPEFDFETFKVVDESFDFEDVNNKVKDQEELTQIISDLPQQLTIEDNSSYFLENDKSNLLECELKSNISDLNTIEEENVPSVEKTTGEAPGSAEIILICTSLGSIRRQFFASRRAKNFLDCKGAPYFLIDANRDVSEGTNLKDQQLLNQWVDMKLIKLNSTANTETNTSSIVIPQIIIDGIPIGNETSLQDLEEDTYLDLMIVQSICPACLTSRRPQDTQCSSCSARFLRLIPPNFVAEQAIQQICCGLLYYNDSDEPLDSSF